MAIKATARSGRAGKFGVYNANHNTLEATRSQESHIDHERTINNRYAYWDEQGKVHNSPSFNAKEQEQKMYEHFFNEGIAARNQRYINNRHAERCKTVEDFLKDAKTAPFETIFQIDKKGSTVASPEQLWKIASQTVLAMAKQSGGHFQPLNFALHVDETTGHVHCRAVFMAKDKEGNWMPGQNAALKEMGFERPNPDKPLNRYNNPLISFSDALRNDFYDRCEREGIEIDRTVKNPSKRHLEALEYKHQELEATIASKDALIADKDKQLTEKDKQIKSMQADIKNLKEGIAILTAADGVIQQAASTLSREKSIPVREYLPEETKGVFKKEIVKPAGVRVDEEVWQRTAQAAHGKATAMELQNAAQKISNLMKEAAVVVDGVELRHQIEEMQKHIQELQKQYQKELAREQKRAELACKMLEERGMDGFELEYQMRLFERFDDAMQACQNGEKFINDAIIEAYNAGDTDLMKKLVEAKRELPEGTYSISNELNGAKTIKEQLALTHKIQGRNKLHNEMDNIVFGRTDWKMQKMLNELARLIEDHKDDKADIHDRAHEHDQDGPELGD